MTIESDQAKLERLKTMIDEGIQALDRGEYVEVDDAELDAFLDSLGAADETLGYGCLPRT
jgi:antitoxin ParD1/3/4